MIIKKEKFQIYRRLEKPICNICQGSGICIHHGIQNEEPWGFTDLFSFKCDDCSYTEQTYHKLSHHGVGVNITRNQCPYCGDLCSYPLLKDKPIYKWIDKMLWQKRPKYNDELIGDWAVTFDQYADMKILIGMLQNNVTKAEVYAFYINRVQQFKIQEQGSPFK